MGGGGRVDVPEQRAGLHLGHLFIGNADGADRCLTDPGFEVDLDVTASLGALTRYWVGRAS